MWYTRTYRRLEIIAIVPCDHHKRAGAQPKVCSEAYDGFKMLLLDISQCECPLTTVPVKRHHMQQLLHTL